MTLWLDLFTGGTWKQFQDAGATISGFNQRTSNVAKQVAPGYILLCYMTGVMRWVGALEVIGKSRDTSPIWGEGMFPVRFQVKSIIMLMPEHGIPMDALIGKVSFFQGPKDKGKYKGFVRQSLKKFKSADGDVILKLLQDAKQAPQYSPVDQKKLARKPFFQVKLKKGDKTFPTVVSVPEIDSPSSNISQESEETTHSLMQLHLLELGASMGLDIWVAKNDRNRKASGVRLGSVDRMLEELPTQFNEPAQKTVELIDVLWLDKKAIVAAFEIEHTTSVYSGLLRMSDLVSLVPNLEIRLYLVAPYDRYNKVQSEILRPTFQILPKPLTQLCRFMPFEELSEKISAIKKLGIATSLKPVFLESISKSLLKGGSEEN